MNSKKRGKRAFSHKKTDSILKKNFTFSPEYFENIEEVENHLNLEIKKKKIIPKKKKTKNIQNFYVLKN